MPVDLLQEHRRPTISIGLPVFNGGRFLSAAIDSLLAQSFHDFDLIISDNASTDETERICREYASRDTRIQYIRQPANRGALANFQFVLDKADADYFMWAAADDIFHSKWLEILLPVARSHQCLSFGLVSTIDAAGAKAPSHPADSIRMRFSGAPLFRRLKYFVFPGTLGKANLIHGVCPTSHLREPGMIRLEAESIGADQVFLYALLKKTDIRHAGNTFLYKRVHNNSAGATTVPDRHQSILCKLKRILEGAFQIPLVWRYVRQSSVLESILLAFCYPAFILLNAVVGLSPRFLTSRSSSKSSS